MREVLWGVLSGMTSMGWSGVGRKQHGQKKLNCDTAAAEVAAEPRVSSGAELMPP